MLSHPKDKLILGLSVRFVIGTEACEEFIEIGRTLSRDNEAAGCQAMTKIVIGGPGFPIGGTRPSGLTRIHSIRCDLAVGGHVCDSLKKKEAGMPA
jgi:hypothetical protein